MAAKQLDGHPGDRIGDLRTNSGDDKEGVEPENRDRRLPDHPH